MRLILAIDGFFLKFFERIAHAFARLTGKSNFFLAKCMIWLCIVGSMTIALNYWLPILGHKTNPIFAAFFGANALLFLIDLHLCEKAEAATMNDKRIGFFGPAIYWPVFRGCMILFNIIFAPSSIARLISPTGILPAKILDELYLPAFAAYVYFASLDPPQVGKSKVREWAEGFASMFCKPATATAKKK